MPFELGRMDPRQVPSSQVKGHLPLSDTPHAAIHRCIQAEWCCVLQGAVGAMGVEVCHVLGQHCLEVAVVDDQHSVEYLVAEGADPSLGDSVGPGCPHRCAQDSDAFAGEHGIEDAGELAVAVLDQEREACQTVVEVHQEIARLLSDPGTGGVGGDAQEVDATGGVLHNEQHIEPVQQHCVDAEEVGGENAVCLGGQELPPGGAAAALRCICAGDTPKRPQL
jgi:hypothetical protein